MILFFVGFFLFFILCGMSLIFLIFLVLLILLVALFRLASSSPLSSSSLTLLLCLTILPSFLRALKSSKTCWSVRSSTLETNGFIISLLDSIYLKLITKLKYLILSIYKSLQNIEVIKSNLFNFSQYLWTHHLFSLSNEGISAEANFYKSFRYRYDESG